MANKSKLIQKATAAEHYRRNAPEIKARAKAHNAKTSDIVRAWVAEYLRGHPCVDCGEIDSIVLEFYHRDRAAKRIEISRMLRRGFSLESVKAEVGKCDVRCANCHRRKTHQQRLSEGGSLKSIEKSLPLFGSKV